MPKMISPKCGKLIEEYEEKRNECIIVLNKYRKNCFYSDFMI